MSMIKIFSMLVTYGLYFPFTNQFIDQTSWTKRTDGIYMNNYTGELRPTLYP